MKNILFFALLFIFCACEKENITTGNIDAEIERIGKAAIISGATPGMSIGIIHNGTVKTYSFGVRNLETGEPFDENTIGEIGSITKPFTAYLVAELVLENKISLSDSANQYLPSALRLPSRNGKSVRVEHLLNHTSGLAANPADLNANPHKEEQPYNYSETRLAEYLSKTSLSQDPGEKWVYSNIGMGLAGVLVKQLSGKRVTDLYLEKFFQPLGMDNTFTNYAETPSANVAQGYTGKTPFGFFEMSEMFEAAGVIKSNVRDMLLYLNWAINTEDPALQLTKQQTFLITKGDYPVNGVAYKDLGTGLAWGILRNQKGESIFNHSGGTYGFSSFIAFNETQKTGVILISNAAFTPDVSGQGLAILELLDKY